MESSVNKDHHCIAVLRHSTKGPRECRREAVVTFPVTDASNNTTGVHLLTIIRITETITIKVSKTTTIKVSISNLTVNKIMEMEELAELFILDKGAAIGMMDLLLATESVRRLNKISIQMLLLNLLSVVYRICHKIWFRKV